MHLNPFGAINTVSLFRNENVIKANISDENKKFKAQRRI